RLYANTSNPGIQVVYARAADIPLYVESGAADMGITGEDMLQEREAKVRKLLEFNFGKCRIAVAAPKDSDIKSPEDYRGGMKVATKLVNVAKGYFNSRNVFCEVIPVAGATELAPYMGIADLIVDQVSTGTTLTENNLRVVDVISESCICLIANEKSMLEKEDEVDALKVSIESVSTAELKRYVIANVIGDDALERVLGVMPAMDSPTVMKLAKPGSYSVQSVVAGGELIPTIRKLKKAGAKDILVMNMSRVVE
ncbi:TPA: ATP phosphoribosyltransferase, partial [Candidatus Micrarchaeota archaeon]|nr:ATP phosphoribosyltransferase [Candidatus Micrarchaeota archaeon]